MAWFVKAADAGSVPALTSIGALYASGQGVAKDETVALTWFQKAADGGSSMAMLWIGTFCRDGRGCPKDPVQARKWFTKSAEAGNPAGMYLLGYCFENGVGTDKDMTQARSWYQMAARAGSGERGYGSASMPTTLESLSRTGDHFFPPDNAGPTTCHTNSASLCWPAFVRWMPSTVARAKQKFLPEIGGGSSRSGTLPPRTAARYRRHCRMETAAIRTSRSLGQGVGPSARVGPNQRRTDVNLFGR